MATARQHHYIPQFYLKGFARKPHKTAKVYVFDMHKGAWLPHPTNPKNIGTVRDFNRINAEDLPPDALETSLSAFETEAARVIRNICEKREMPEADEWLCTVNLIALLSVRNPRVREGHADFVKQIAEQITGLTLATKERWESSVKQMKEDGYGADLPDVSYEEMLRFYEEKRYDIKVGNGLFIPAEFHALETVINTLLARKWTLLVAGDCAGHFVCCDHPVRLRWSDPEGEKFIPPGHAMAGSEIVFPLSKELVLIGTFEGSQRKIIADRKVIAMVNTVIIEGSDRQIFSPINDFEFFSTDGIILSSSEVLHNFKRIDHKRPSRKR